MLQSRRGRRGSAALLVLGAAAGWAGVGEAIAGPVYLHMNGANELLENVVAARPGEKVVFVNEDTDSHAIAGYNAETGTIAKRFDGVVLGTKGPGHKVSTYAITFENLGIEYCYCSIHAELKREPGGRYLPKVRPGVAGFGAPTAGLIIVTTDPKLLAANPKSASTKILPGFFGG